NRLPPVLPRSRSLLNRHSFPTRRSSDLSRILYGEIPQVEQDLAAAEAADDKVTTDEAPMVSEQVSAHDIAEVIEAWTGIPAGRIDRKSTRLNSSHVSISYAVFCLKKKNS